MNVFDPLLNADGVATNLVKYGPRSNHPIRSNGELSFRIATVSPNCTVSIAHIDENGNWLTDQRAGDEIAASESMKLENSVARGEFVGVKTCQLLSGDIVMIGKYPLGQFSKCFIITASKRLTTSNIGFFDTEALVGFSPAEETKILKTRGRGYNPELGENARNQVESGRGLPFSIACYRRTVAPPSISRPFMFHSGDIDPYGTLIHHMSHQNGEYDAVIVCVGYKAGLGAKLENFRAQDPVLLFHGTNSNANGVRQLYVCPLNFVAGAVQQAVAYVKFSESGDATVFILDEPLTLDNGVTGQWHENHSSILAAARAQYQQRTRAVTATRNDSVGEHAYAPMLSQRIQSTESPVHVAAHDILRTPSGDAPDMYFGTRLSRTPPRGEPVRVTIPIASGYPVVGSVKAILYGEQPIAEDVAGYTDMLANAPFVVVHCKEIRPELASVCKVRMNCVFVIHAGEIPHGVDTKQYVADANIGAASIMGGPFSVVLVYDGQYLYYHSGVSPMLFGARGYKPGTRFTVDLLKGCGAYSPGTMPPLYQYASNNNVYIYDGSRWVERTCTEAEEALVAMPIDTLDKVVYATNVVAQLERVLTASELDATIERLRDVWGGDPAAFARAEIKRMISARGIVACVASHEMNAIRKRARDLKTLSEMSAQLVDMLNGTSSKLRITRNAVNAKNAVRAATIKASVADTKAMSPGDFHTLMEDHAGECQSLFFVFPTNVARAALNGGLTSHLIATEDTDLGEIADRYDDSGDDSGDARDQLGYHSRLKHIDALSAGCAIETQNNARNPLDFNFNGNPMVLLYVLEPWARVDGPYLHWRNVANSQEYGHGLELAKLRHKLRELVWIRSGCVYNEGSNEIGGACVVILVELLKIYVRSLSSSDCDPENTTTQTVRGLLSFLFTILASGSNVMFSSAVGMFMPEPPAPEFDTARFGMHLDLARIAEHAAWDLAPMRKTMLHMLARHILALAADKNHAQTISRRTECTGHHEPLVRAIMTVIAARALASSLSEEETEAVRTRIVAFFRNSEKIATNVLDYSTKSKIPKTPTQKLMDALKTGAKHNLALDKIAARASETIKRYRNLEKNAPEMCDVLFANLTAVVANLVAGTSTGPATVKDVYDGLGIDKFHSDIEPVIKFFRDTGYRATFHKHMRNQVLRALNVASKNRFCTFADCIANLHPEWRNAYPSPAAAESSLRTVLSSITGTQDGDNDQVVARCDTSFVTNNHHVVDIASYLGIDRSKLDTMVTEAAVNPSVTAEQLMSVARA